MNYQHHYHAGSFADVLKHLVLAELILTVRQKETPFGYIDTHAGAGLYDLRAAKAQKTQEFSVGIERLLSGSGSASQANVNDMNETLAFYIKAVRAAGYPHYYPGSPWLATAWLRSIDTCTLIEKHPETVQELKSCFDPKTGNPMPNPTPPTMAIHQRDAYEGLKALLPRQPSRGLILIDPPYEKNNEWAQCSIAVQHAVMHYRQGIFAIWYPIKGDNDGKRDLRQLREILPATVPLLKVELSVLDKTVRQGLIGSGMIILNPPWQLKSRIEAWLPVVWQRLSPEGKGYCEIQTVVR